MQVKAQALLRIEKEVVRNGEDVQGELEIALDARGSRHDNIEKTRVPREDKASL